MMASPHADAWSLDHRPGLRRALVALIFILGALPKLIYLYSHGALWGDEAALAMNIGPRGSSSWGGPSSISRCARGGRWRGSRR